MSDARHSAAASSLPYPVGRFSPASWATALLLAAVLAVGLYAYAQQFTHGEILTGMRTVGQGGGVWALYIVFDMYFVSISFTGILVAALVRLLKVRDLQPITRLAGLLTLVALPAAGMMVIADLGRPLLGLLALPKYARPMSPFFGTFTLVVSGYLFASLVYFFLDGRADAARCAREGHPRWRWIYRLWASGYRDTAAERERHSKVTFWLALVILPLMVIASSTLGFVFGIQGGRPGWHSALQAPSFVVLGSASGIGMLLALAALVRRVLGLREQIPDRTFRVLGNILWGLVLLSLYFVAVDALTSFYASSEATVRVAREIVFGVYAPFFWIALGSLAAAALVGLWMFLSPRVHVGWLAAAGLLVNVAAVLKRLLIVVPSQTHGMLLPYEPGRYVPTAIELAVIAGVLAFVGLLLLIFVRLFTVVPLPAVAPAPSPVRENARPILRPVLVGGALTGGFALMTVGLLISLRFGTEPYLDPIIPFSPIIFVKGIMLAFFSAVIYELLPPGGASAPPAAAPGLSSENSSGLDPAV